MPIDVEYEVVRDLGPPLYLILQIEGGHACRFVGVRWSSLVHVFNIKVFDCRLRRRGI